MIIFFVNKKSINEIKAILTKKWNKFERLFLKNFAKAYAEDIQSIKLESFYQPPLDLLRDPYKIYEN